MGGINFGWLAVWVLWPDWLRHILNVCDFLRPLVEAAASGGVRDMPRFCIVYPGICLTTEENHEKLQSE
jgi:hypothetical protein